MNKFTPVVLAAVAGCIEYTPSGETVVEGVPNPRPLATPLQSDKIVQVQQPQVDILWIVDNSCSMYEEQTDLTKNFPVFLDFFLGSGLDYHIGVVSTDMDDASHSGRLRAAGGVRFIDEDTVNPSSVFSQMALMGTSGSGWERGIDAGYSALEKLKDGYNAGFLRETSGIHAIVISDESDYSDAPVNEFVNYLNGLRIDQDTVTFSSVVAPDPVCNGASTPGTRYIQTTQGVGGIYTSICTEQWDVVLEELGLQASGLKREYFLSQLPVVDSIVVRVIENGIVFLFEKDTDWTYNPSRNSISFVEYVPNPLAEIHIDYQVLAAVEQ